MKAAVQEHEPLKTDNKLDNPVLKERERLLRFCTRLTGSRETAEDLVQETLLEAWRHEEQLRNPERRVQWLFGIAYRMFLRWGRRRGHDVLTGSTELADDAVQSDEDVELELERGELAELLDRALGMLSADARRILVKRYVEDLPQAVIAEHLGISEGAVAVRLHRGRLALRHVLLSDLQDEAAAYGLSSGAQVDWTATRMWCPTCGMARVAAYRNAADGVFLVRCPHCASSTTDRSAAYLRNLQGDTRAMIHSLRSARHLYFTAIENDEAPCPRCGASVPLRRGLPPEFAGSTNLDLGVHLLCGQCGVLSHQPVYGLALSLPETERFWRRNRRMRTRPAERITTGERPGIVITFESVTDSNRLDVVLDLESFRPIGIHG